MKCKQLRVYYGSEIGVLQIIIIGRIMFMHGSYCDCLIANDQGIINILVFQLGQNKSYFAQSWELFLVKYNRPMLLDKMKFFYIDGITIRKWLVSIMAHGVSIMVHGVSIEKASLFHLTSDPNATRVK